MAFRKRSKYGVDMTAKGKQKRSFEGVVWDSELELKIYRDYLLPLKAQGEILCIELHKEFILQPAYNKDGKRVLPVIYESDYAITWKDGSFEVWDAKGGMIDPVATLKKKIFNYVYPDIKLRWVTLSLIDGGVVEYDVVKKARAERKKAKKNKG